MCEGASLARYAQSEPVILLGRGGSGTRLLSQLAQASGIFLGNEVNSTGDSVEWVPDLYELAIESVTAEIPTGSLRDSYWRNRLLNRAAELLDRAGLSPEALWGWK